MGIAEAIEAVRQLGIVRTEAGRLLIEVDRRHWGTGGSHRGPQARQGSGGGNT